MLRWIVALLISALAFCVGCTPPAEPAAEESQPSGAVRQDAPASDLGIAEEAQLVADALRDADGVADAVVAMKLQRPIVVVTLAESARSDLEAATQEITASADSVDTGAGVPCSYMLELVSAEGDLLGRIPSLDQRWVLQAPPAPSDAGQLEAWLSLVYCST